MISRATLYSSPGGDTVQVIETANYLRKLNVEVDILIDDVESTYEKYDLLHFFNVIRPADILYHVRKSRKPYVLSTIFVDYTEIDRQMGGKLRRMVSKYLGSDFSEYLKTIARAILNGEKIKDWRYLVWGHRNSVRKIIKESKLLLPNSKSEYDRLFKKYHEPKTYLVVPNAVDLSKFDLPCSEDRFGVLCVARIEPLKNQLRLIQAINRTKYKLIIVGKPSPNHMQYYLKCRQEARENVTFLDHVPQSELHNIYSKAKVHVLASWFETTGLSSLEAAICGCNIVITDRGDTSEYFGKYAYYCEPDDVSSIVRAIDKAHQTPVNTSFQDMIRMKYTWSNTASVTFQAYRQVVMRKD